MIQQQTILKVADNSGARTAKCIKVLGGFKRKYSYVGETIVVSIQKLRNKAKNKSKVKKGEIYKAVIIRTKAPVKKKDGSIKRNDGNYITLVNKQNNPIGTRILSPISKKLKKKIYIKISNISKGFLKIKMIYIGNLYKKISKRFLLNKFLYTNCNEVPKIKSIILNMNFKRLNTKYLALSLLALETISLKRGELTKTKKPNASLKIQKGEIVGCKIHLKKRLMHNFLNKFLIEIIPQLQNEKDFFIINNYKNNKSLSYTLKQKLLFSELESNFLFFSEIPNIQVTFLTNTRTNGELKFLLKSSKINVK